MACKRIGIKAVDVQHGRAGATGQKYYSRWTKFPKNSNYEIMPDVFWTWTEADKRAIDKWETDKIIAYNGGKPIYATLNQLKDIADISAIKK